MGLYSRNDATLIESKDGRAGIPSWSFRATLLWSHHPMTRGMGLVDSMGKMVVPCEPLPQHQAPWRRVRRSPAHVTISSTKQSSLMTVRAKRNLPPHSREVHNAAGGHLVKKSPCAILVTERVSSICPFIRNNHSWPCASLCAGLMATIRTSGFVVVFPSQ